MVRPTKHSRRVSDDFLDKVFPDVPTITIEGAKAVNKTETARRRIQCIPEPGDPHTPPVLRVNTGVLFGIDEAVLIDRWRHYPPVWDRVRRMMDRRRDPAILFTGSATLRPDTTSHSDARHIASLTMRPMSLTEHGVAPGGIDVTKLLEREAMIEGHSPPRLPDYAERICAFELPGLRDTRPAALGLQLDSYLARIVDRDLPEEGVLVRRPQTLMAWLAICATVTSTPASYTAILRVATAGETGKPSCAVAQTYRNLPARIQMFDPVSDWATLLTPLARLKIGPKYQLFDPALAARLLDVTPVKPPSGAPGSGEILGRLFEALVTLYVRIRATATRLRISHLRTRNGNHEIDLIVKDTAGRVVAIEIKLTCDPNDAGVRCLHWLGDRIGGCLVDKVVVATGEYAYRRDDGVAVIPLGLLS